MTTEDRAGVEDDESSDEDFELKNEDSSDDEDFKQKARQDDLDSGDEATMRVKGARQVTTRRSKALEKPEPKVPAPTRSDTDIDALWKEMKEKRNKEDEEMTKDLVSIKRTYEFAGEVKTEIKDVPKDSAEAKAYFANVEATAAKQPTPVSRPKKRPSALETAAGKKAPKLNTLEKSRLDWAGFVDQEGIGDDLKRFNKGGYLQEQDFLQRVSAKRDAEWKSARKP